MYCKKCGALNQDGTARCVQCGEPLGAVPPGSPGQQVPNYLVWSILVTLLCCLPLGIPAIIYAAQVNGKVQAGDYPGAMESSKKAKMWCWIACGVGIVANLIGVAIGIFSATLQQQLQR